LHPFYFIPTDIYPLRRENVRRSPGFTFLPPKKNFIQAKYDFIDEMLKFGKFPASPAAAAAAASASAAATAAGDGEGASMTAAGAPLKILDVGCGIGGTSR
jgi:hypothetical protein